MVAMTSHRRGRRKEGTTRAEGRTSGTQWLVRGEDGARDRCGEPRRRWSRRRRARTRARGRSSTAAANTGGSARRRKTCLHSSRNGPPKADPIDPFAQSPDGLIHSCWLAAPRVPRRFPVSSSPGSDQRTGRRCAVERWPQGGSVDRGGHTGGEVPLDSLPFSSATGMALRCLTAARC
jgi:hypothetical protein